MAETHVYEGKTSTEAIQKGLKELNVKKEDVEINIVKEEKRSFFSILEPRIVKVEIIVKEKKQNEKKEEKRIVKEKREMSEEAIKKAKQNIEEFLKAFLGQVSENQINYEITNDTYYVYVALEGENTNFLIGYRGETLNALQTLISSIANKNIEEKIRVIVDISGYREKRKKVLESLAEKMARTVIKTRKKITLEPMSAYERKVIHAALQNNHKVTTESVGEEPNRKVVILLKK